MRTKESDKLTQPWEREWMQLKAGRPAVIEKKRICPVCKKKLSKYNLGKYCFNHQFENTKEEDKEWELRRERQMIYLRTVFNSFFTKFYRFHRNKEKRK